MDDIEQKLITSESRYKTDIGFYINQSEDQKIENQMLLEIVKEKEFSISECKKQLSEELSHYKNLVKFQESDISSKDLLITE